MRTLSYNECTTISAGFLVSDGSLANSYIYAYSYMYLAVLMHPDEQIVLTSIGGAVIGTIIGSTLLPIAPIVGAISGCAIGALFMPVGVATAQRLVFDL